MKSQTPKTRLKTAIGLEATGIANREVSDSEKQLVFLIIARLEVAYEVLDSEKRVETLAREVSDSENEVKNLNHEVSDCNK